ncbi:restriction endonuclease subunit S [Aminivibrio sp.]|uniref:restriction endonuclease subunit S n=1 Tax=Aminivibrio sp. TaxID=1872489 RepID=UPI001A3B7BCA|nr:restriction endonuclease subunit S [Aminivibrio sp.]MBL3538238.1 restriction endonuclease subunit S [Aminivibrio sp.]
MERIRENREERYVNECDEARRKGERNPRHFLPVKKSGFSEVSCSWVDVEIQQICNVETGATPLKSNVSYYDNGKVPWIKSGDIQNGDIWECKGRISEKALKETNVKYYPVDTLLIAMYGEGKTRGQIGRLKFPATSNQACAALVNPSLDEATRMYIFLYGLSQYERLRMQSAGGNQPNLSLEKIKEWVLPLPPLEEQKEIVRQVDKLFSLADKVEEHYQKARARVDALAQSVLAKAFRGELVPQDPDDEPAEKLLQRIREEKAKMENELKNASRSARGKGKKGAKTQRNRPEEK